MSVLREQYRGESLHSNSKEIWKASAFKMEAKAGYQVVVLIDRVYEYIDTPLLVLLKVWSYILRHEMGHVILAPAQSQLPHYILYQPVKVFSSETARYLEEERGKEHLDSITTYIEVSADLVSKVDMEKIYRWIKKIDHDKKRKFPEEYEKAIEEEFSVATY